MRQTYPLILLALSACDPAGKGGELDAELSEFESCQALKDHLSESFVHQFTAYSSMGFAEDIALDSGESSAPSDYSETNTQEAGVDEPDMVKTDGEFIYMSQDNMLRIVSSWPVEDTQEVGRLGLSGSSSKMFLHGDRILAYSTEYTDREGRWTAQTVVDVIDVSDRSNPQMMSTKSIDGQFVSARRVGGDVYTVTQQNLTLPTEAYSSIWDAYDEADAYVAWDASPLAKETSRRTIQKKIRPLIQSAIQGIPANKLLPQVTSEDGTTETIAGCTDILHSAEVSEPGVTLVTHIDLDNDRIEVSGDATAVMAGSTTVYASQRSLYVAQSSAGWWDGFSSVDRVTRLHRFTLAGPATEYTASGQVDGFLHNQFSMSEHEGLLRIATTNQDWWWGTGSDDEDEGNNIFVLDAESPQMPIIGELRGLAPGERIYATRFQADRAFMVTFVQIDPLFTIDLSQPTHPTAVGELKIPGYSAYLQAIGEDHVLGVGMDGDWDGGLTGVAVSLFDVSDFSDPKQQDQISMDFDHTSSEALWNHHAILVHNNTVAVPVYGYNWRSDYESASGLLVATIDTETGLTQTGFVDHSELAEEIWADDSASYMPQMLRSLTIENNLFSISDVGIMVSDLDNPELPIASVAIY